MTAAPVLFNELAAQGGQRIGEVILNVPATLNSLTLEMVELMLDQLARWRDDEGLVAVVIRGSGEKAFCAGGDVQALYKSAIANPGGPCVDAENFFAREYRLDYSIHTYPKPLIGWGHGIVMGGGMGVFSGCKHRVVTERTRIAMPEVGIALFPDVGGSYFLNRMPGHSGAFLALTGASINAADCLYGGLADHFITNEHYDTVLAALQVAEWRPGDNAANHDRCGQVLASIAAECAEHLPAGNLEANMGEIEVLFRDPEPLAVIKAILAIDSSHDWMNKARDGLAYGSPLNSLLIYQQLLRTRGKSLAEVFQAELVLVTNIARFREFAEGVRALLIDKDRKPDWTYKTQAEVPAEVIESFFQAPWAENPLSDLS
ncbi:MAG: enoyl-CoA hydratase/isomerase family protein [Porticoccaceae bacterium]|nr:enoyl-CoA hydratase/isomerase family protein [Porticoccaceae bacterium]